MDCRPGLNPDQETALEITIAKLKQDHPTLSFGFFNGEIKEPSK
jgi:hypothetical protein